MTPAGRRWRSLLLVSALVVSVLGVVWAATRADGRAGSASSSNDGGAWLLHRRAGAIGHLNREVLEVTAGVRIAEPGANFDVDQAQDIVVVHDRSTARLLVFDNRLHRVQGEMLLFDNVQVSAIDGGVAIVRRDPFAVWQLNEEELLRHSDLADMEPDHHHDSSGQATLGGDRVVAYLPDPGILVALPPVESSGRQAATSPRLLDLDAGDVRAMTTAGPFVALASTDELIVAVAPGGDDRTGDTDGPVSRLPLDTGPVVLQQPGRDGSGVAFVDSGGEIHLADLASGAVAPLGHQLGGADPLPPIRHEGCIFTLVAEPPTYAKYCESMSGWDLAEQVALTDAGSNLRLRLVNGWIWVNDVDNGTAWIANARDALARVDDWGAALADDEDADADATIEESGGLEEVRLNPDAERAQLREADERDEDDENDPPVARDDEAETRVDRPVIVRVTDNDEDPDGDVILIDEARMLDDTSALIAVTTSRDAVQITPPAGYSGRIHFSYRISDGRGGTDEAVATVDVTSATPETNRPPEPVTDTAAVRRGSPVSLNVLTNDRDPDGDSLALLDVSEGEGIVVFDPSGQITYTPHAANDAEGEVELTYVVADDFGATAEGRIRIRLRLAEANNPPDARNDAVATSVGNPARINLIDNDTDPDGDPLIVARRPVLVQRPGSDAEGPLADTTAGDSVVSTDDGEFSFVPEEGGTYVFHYVVSDGQATDSAQIRVDVTDTEQNLLPVAIRDDVTIPRGATRLVRVLDNDGDANGDVVGIVEWSGAQGVRIEEVPGTGFRVTVDADAPDRVVFRYAISDGNPVDGVVEPVATVVVVSVVDVEPVNQPPVLRADSVDLRRGRTTTLRVLDNDYDPEGGSLSILRATSAPGLEVELSVGADGQSIVVSLPDTADPLPEGPSTLPSSFTLGYDVADESGATSASTVEVRVVHPSAPNRPPVARLDVGRTTESQTIPIAVIANDTDPDGDALTLESITSQPTHGTAEIQPDGTVHYTPRDSFTGTDLFLYVVVDTEGARSIGRAQIGVSPKATENRPPAANDDLVPVAGTPSGATPEAVVLDVLANDFDPDGDDLTIVDHTDPARTDAARGSLELVAGELRFRPPAVTPVSEEGATEISFSYTISDGHGNDDDAFVRILLEAAPEPIAPLAVGDQIGPIRGNRTITVDVLGNDRDPDGDPATLELTSEDPAVTVDGDRLEIEVGNESSQHRYTITDDDGLSASGTVTVFVVDNEAPALAPFTGTTDYETALTIDLGDQPSDPDGDPLLFVCCDRVQGGVAEVVGLAENALVVRYEPSPGFSGPGGFSYQVDDQAGHLVAGQANITVGPPDNRPPTASSGSVEIEAGATIPYALSGLVEDPDPNDTTTFTILGGLSESSAVQASLDGSTLQITAGYDRAGATATIRFRVADDAGATAEGVLDVIVTSVAAAPPQAVSDTARTHQATAVTIPVLVNDIDPLGGGLTISSPGGSDDGQVAVAGDGITFTPHSDFFGTSTFTYTIRDATEDAIRESVAQVTVDVIGRPAAPAPPAAAAENATATLTWATPVGHGATIEAYRIEYTSSVGHDGSIEVGTPANSRAVAGLVNGDEYQFRLQARNEAGWGEWSPWSPPVRPDTRPDAPSPPTVAFGDGELEVGWSPPANNGSVIVGYQLEIGGGTNEILRLGTGTTHTWRGLTNGVEYQFRVAAVNAAGTSRWSGWSANEHPLGPPAAPRIPGAGRGDRHLDVSWATPANNGDPIISYEIEIRSTNQRVSAPGSATTTYRWADLANGVTQEFRVRATNRAASPGDWSGWSAPVKPCAVPDTVLAPSTVRGDSQVSVGWSPPDDQGCSISSYNIRAAASGGATIIQTAGAGASAHVFTGLANGAGYAFAVQAVNEEGAGIWSPASAIVVPAGPPTAPSISTATPTGRGQVRITWGGADANGTPIVSHQLRINGGAPVAVSTTTHTAIGLADNTSYGFQARSCNDVACGPWSATVSTTTWGPPTAPRNVSASAGNATWSFTWSTPSSDGGASLIGYEHRVNGGAASSVSASTFSYALVSPTNDTTYTGEVRACNTVGCGPWASASAMPRPPPPAVSVSVGGVYNGPASCAGNCRWLEVSVTGLAPNTATTLSCVDNRDDVFKNVTYTSSASGSLSATPCYYGYSGSIIWASVNGVESNRITWP